MSGWFFRIPVEDWWFHGCFLLNNPSNYELYPSNERFEPNEKAFNRSQLELRNHPQGSIYKAAPFKPPTRHAMLSIMGGSLAFSVGAAFMKSSQGFTRLVPTAVVMISFLLGAAFLTRAVKTNNMSTTVIVGLGIEAVITVSIGIFLLGDRLSVRQAIGVLLVLVGTALVHRYEGNKRAETPLGSLSEH